MFQGTGCRICGKLLPWQPLVLKKVKHSAGLFVGQVPGFQGSFILYEYIIVKHKQYLVVSIYMIHISTIYCSDCLQHIGQGILLEKLPIAAFSWILRFCTKLNANNKTSQVPSLWKNLGKLDPAWKTPIAFKMSCLAKGEGVDWFANTVRKKNGAKSQTEDVPTPAVPLCGFQRCHAQKIRRQCLKTAVQDRWYRSKWVFTKIGVPQMDGL